MEIRDGQELPQGNTGDSSAPTKDTEYHNSWDALAHCRAAFLRKIAAKEVEIRAMHQKVKEMEAYIKGLEDSIALFDEAQAQESTATGAESNTGAIAVDPVAEAQG